MAPSIDTSRPESVLELHRPAGAPESVRDDAGCFYFLSSRQLKLKLYTGKGIALIFMLRIKIQVMGFESRFLYSSRLNGNNLFPGA